MDAVRVRVLLVSRHIETIETLSHFMERLAMQVELCSTAESAQRRLCHAKFEAVMVDLLDKEAALKLVSRLRESTSHRAVVSFVIVNRSADVQTAFRAGATFVIHRPWSPGAIEKTFKASYAMMVREKRRYFRCPVQMPTYVRKGTGPEFKATSINLSEAGIALDASTPVQVGERLKLTFALPETKNSLVLTAEVCWTDPKGRAGLQFVAVPAQVVDQLQSWLAGRLQDLLPPSGSPGGQPLREPLEVGA